MTFHTPPQYHQSKDWDGDKARNREQKSLIDTLLDKETQDGTQDMQEEHLISDVENLTLEQDKATPNKTDTLILPPETSEEKQETEGTEVNNNVMAYSMTEQELKLQHEEEKYGIYMNTFGYEGDDSELDTESDVMAYPYLD